VRFYEWVLAVLILLATVVAVLSRSRLGAVAALGVVGYSVALIFVLFGAPDLAMTQFMVATLTVILFVLVFSHLPRFALFSNRLAVVWDTCVALALGGLITCIVASGASIQLFPKISQYFIDTSVSLAHGRNVVNVILVDFRGFDTLGEITRLANLITLTPGSVSLDVSSDRRFLYLHAMYIDDVEQFRASIKNSLERRVLEVLR
jgi:multicomponent Na+:H+ antiporter subunit A